MTSRSVESEVEGGGFSAVETEEVVERVGLENVCGGNDLGFRWKRLERKFRLERRGVERVACWADRFVNQVCRSRFSSSGLVSRKPQ